ncbi:MAG: 50S ribosomal protein L18 [Fimbriimonadaceae bacterium]|nr:50S ribosomal protein L18 [Fimbriimonadaceae bacterium]
MANKTRQELRKARHARIRKRITGTADRPRLSVFRSLKHISAQIIDDTKGLTLAAVSTVQKDLGPSGNIENAKAAGKLLAEKAKAAGITSVVFDRGGFQYHGRVAAFAEGAREGGLEF